MEDVLTAHADRVRDANDEHLRRAEEIQQRASAELSATIDKFSDAMAELIRCLNSAAMAVAGTVKAISSNAQNDLEEAFSANVMAIVASETEMRAAMSARQTFFATGRLPEPAAMPDIADGPSLAAVNDQAGPERAAA